MKIAEGEGWEFWDIKGEVYRSPAGCGLDVWGFPMSRRWESTRAHWDRFRSVFSWARDVAHA